MELKLKTNTKISYISEYIKYKFPKYIGKMDSVSFMRLVNSIQFIPDIKNVDFGKLKKGNKDEIIDKYVNQYMKINFPNVFETVNKLCVYICDLLKNNKKFNDSIILLNDISNQIGFDCFNQIDINLVKTGKYDEMFYTRYLEIRNQFISCVKKVIYSMNENVGFSNDTINSLISKIVNDMLSKYDSNKVYDDNLIREKYLNLSNEIKINVKEHIKKVLYNMDLVIGVDTDKVINDLLYMTTVSGQISAIGLINGKLDNLICGHANKNRKHGYNDNDIVDYIYNYLNNIADEEITENQLMDFSKEVKKILMSDRYGYNVSHILEHQCDLVINQLYEERYHSYFVGRNDLIEDYSKKKNDKKSIIYKPKKKSIQKIIAGILLGSSLVVLSSFGVKKISQHVKDEEAIDNAKSLGRIGGYSINYSSKHNEELSYIYAANDVLSYYNELIEYGPEYIHLCFYNAYCDGLSLDELNNVIIAVKDFIGDDEKYAELSNLIGDSKLYIDYIYNSLIMMGCEDVKDDKFINAVNAYKLSYHGNMYGVASDYHLNEEDKMNLEILMRLYEKYSRNCQIELGNIMEENENISKRGIK